MLQMISIVLPLQPSRTFTTYDLYIYCIYMLHGSSIGCLSAFHRTQPKMNSELCPLFQFAHLCEWSWYAFPIRLGCPVNRHFTVNEIIRRTAFTIECHTYTANIYIWFWLCMLDKHLLLPRRQRKKMWHKLLSGRKYLNILNEILLVSP